MNNKVKVVMNWSSGKDAALAFHTLLHQAHYEVTHLLTTISMEYDRVFMHGISEELLDIQAARMNMPLLKVKLPASPDDALYKQAMSHALTGLSASGVHTAAFGDIFLADLRAYREQQLAAVGFTGLFPLWNTNTRDLVHQVEQACIEAIIVCVNEQFLGKEFLGRRVDATLLADLPANVDPCGENGEFHTFVHNAPFFSEPVSFVTGEVVHKTYTPAATDDKSWSTGFYFLDVRPGL